MKPYGFKQHKHNYIDVHPPKGYINWWEIEIPVVKSKKIERQLSKKELKYNNE